MSARVHQHAALQHNAIFYDAPADLTTAAERRARGSRPARSCSSTPSNPVTEALSAVYGDEKRVVFAESPVYGRPVSVIDAYKRIMDRGLAAGVPGYRAMGFIDFDNADLPWQEWLLYEAAVNRVFADYPFRTLCPYDTTEVEPGILEAIRCAHTGLVTPHGVRPNPTYLDPADLVRHEGWTTPRAAVQDDLPHLVLDRTENLTELRLELFPATLMSAVPRQKVDDFVTAVCEVTANAWRRRRAAGAAAAVDRRGHAAVHGHRPGSGHRRRSSATPGRAAPRPRWACGPPASSATCSTSTAPGTASRSGWSPTPERGASARAGCRRRGTPRRTPRTRTGRTSRPGRTGRRARPPVPADASAARIRSSARPRPRWVAATSTRPTRTEPWSSRTRR